jgi:hypothetical protein
MSSQQGQNKGEMPVAEGVRLTDLVNYHPSYARQEGCLPAGTETQPFGDPVIIG